MARPLRVGIQLPEVERVVTWPEVRDIALAVQDEGFDSIWVGDHLLYRNGDEVTGPWEAWSVLAALAEATERISLGPLVAATAFHNPAMLAKKAATVDEISGGRLVLGIGAGWNRAEFDAFGFPYDHRASRFEEALGIIHGLLRGDTVTFDGAFYRVEDCVLVPPARPGGPPIMIGSQGPRVLRAALPFAAAWNGWYAWFGNDVERASELLEVVDDACHEVGRDPRSVSRSVTVLVEAPGSVGNMERAKRWDDPPAVSGSPDDIADVLRRYAAIGIDEVQLVVDPITTGSVRWLGAMLATLDS
ncbi:MAG TPA: LLM class flavin-dependent oxidoreductase [Acidimicrobiia bacterium]|nr:LLM class flavin-dependent oxidoreductase [Acidimicrobiia bacterium]